MFNDGNVFPGQSPRRFFDSDRELLHASSISRYYYLIFCMRFRQLRLFRTLDILKTKYLWRIKGKKNGGQASGWTYRTHVQKIRVYLFQTAWTFGLLCGRVLDLRSWL